MAFQLTITPLTLSNVPSEDEIIQAGQSVLEATGSWKPGKSYAHNTVKTFVKKVSGQPAAWHCRVSEHGPSDATFDEFWSKLGVNKAENEKEYIPDINKVALLKQLSPTQSLWTLYYTFPPPVSPRVFTVLQIIHLDDKSPRKAGYVISIPIDVTKEEGDAELAKMEQKGVKGRYASVERILELENGNVEWRMATTSTPGGNIPQFVADMTTTGKVAEDVPHFLKWFHSTRAQPSS